MSIKKHIEDKQKSIRLVGKDSGKLEQRYGRQNLVVLIYVKDDLGGLRIAVTTSPNWYRSHRRDRSTKLVGLTLAAVPARMWLPGLKVRKRWQPSKNAILRMNWDSQMRQILNMTCGRFHEKCRRIQLQNANEWTIEKKRKLKKSLGNWAWRNRGRHKWHSAGRKANKTRWA